MRNIHALVSSGVKTSDTAVKSTPGKVYWLTLSDTAATVIQLNDSTDDSGTDKWQITIPTGGYIHCNFDPPMQFAIGIYLDVPTGAGDTIIGYV